MNILAQTKQTVAAKGSESVAAVCPCCGGPLSPERANLVETIAGIPLSPIQRTIVDCLAKRFGRWVAIESLISVVWGSDPDGGPISNALQVHCFYAERRLAPFGLRIEGAGRARRKRLVWTA